MSWRCLTHGGCALPQNTDDNDWESGMQNALGNPFCTCHEYEHFTCESEKHK